MRESAGRGGTGLATCALREPGAECRGTFGPFFCPPVLKKRRFGQAPILGRQDAYRPHLRPRTSSTRKGSICGSRGIFRKSRKDTGASRLSVRCRRPTGSGTGGIRISPPGVGDSYRDTSDSDAAGQTGLACDQFRRLARAFRASYRDGILVPAVRSNVRAAQAAATPCAVAVAPRTAASTPARDAPAAPRRANHRHRSAPVAAP